MENYNPETAEKLMNLMKLKNAYWVLTLQTIKLEAYAHEENFISNTNLKYITTIRKKLWWNIDTSKNIKRNKTEDTKGIS